MAQYERPDGVISASGQWTGTYTDIDEVTANDADKLTSTNHTNATDEFSLSNATDPVSSSGHTFRWRGRKTSSAGNVRGITVALVQGTTVIASQAITDMPSTWTAYSTTLTSVQADAITNYNDLRVRVSSTGNTGTPAAQRRIVEFSWFEFEVPDASTPVNITVPLGTLAITGYAPTVAVSDHQEIAVPLGTLGITAYAPTVTATADVAITVPAGSLAITGYAPAIDVSNGSGVIGFNHLTGGDGGSSSPVTTASISPTNGALVLVWVVWAVNSTPPLYMFDADSCSGAGITWTRVNGAEDLVYGGRRGALLYAGISDGTAGALTLSATIAGGSSVVDVLYTVDEFTGIDSGTPYGTLYDNVTGGGSSLSVTVSDTPDSGDWLACWVGVEGSGVGLTINSELETEQYSIETGSDVRSIAIGTESEPDSSPLPGWTWSGTESGVAAAMVINVSSGSPVAVTVPLGTLAITGYAPTVAVSDHQVVAVPLGTLGITAYAPTIAASNHQNITVPAGSLAITGYAPTVEGGEGITVNVPLGTLVITGYAPAIDISDHQAIDVPAGNLSITGYAPTVAAGANLEITVPLGTLAITGYAPAIEVSDHQVVEVPAGSLSITGYAPTVAATADVAITIPAGALVITGYAPVVEGGAGLTINVPAGALAITGYAPAIDVSNHQTIEVPAGTLSITGYSPVVVASDHQEVEAPAGALALTGFAPAVSISDHQAIEVPAAILIITGYAPAVGVSDNQVIEVPAGILVVTGYAPMVSGFIGETIAGVVFINLDPTESVYANPSPAVAMTANPSPTIDVEIG